MALEGRCVFITQVFRSIVTLILDFNSLVTLIIIVVIAVLVIFMAFIVLAALIILVDITDR